jgi:hypothetical protein
MYIECLFILTTIWRSGPWAYCSRGRGFDLFTVQTFVCMNMSVCIGSGYNIYVFTKKIFRYETRYLESITQALQVLTLN